ncbi:MAG: ABC transporter permease [Spirochaetaceae bacterium]|jgi:lipoprotein-releasing system permease protein|nr:ABC transporter permease [Spirochaetaceae bacterium]
MKLKAALMLASSFLKAGGGRFTTDHAIRAGNGGGAAYFRRPSPSNARKSLVSAVFGIGLSLIPLVVVLVVSEGMIQGISSRLIELSSYHIQAIDFSGSGASGRTGNGFSLDELYAFAAEIDTLPGVEQTWIERQGLALAAGKLGRSGATVRAVDPELFEKNEALIGLFEVSDGALSLPEPNTALIGKKLAETIGVGVGETIRLITARERNGNMTPNVSSFTVSGIISSGYQELDALWVYIPLDRGFSILAPASSRTFIGIRTDDPFGPITMLKPDIHAKLPSSFAVYTWFELNRGQYKSFETTKILLLFIMFLIVLVASVNISSALVMLVMERRKEIAILKSIGAPPSGITFVFLLAGFFTGLGGVLCGIPLGILCALNVNSILYYFEKMINFFSYFLYTLNNTGGQFIPVRLLDPAYYLETIPVELPLLELFCICAGTLVLSVVVSIMPSIRAGREKPLNALRKY